MVASRTELAWVSYQQADPARDGGATCACCVRHWRSTIRRRATNGRDTTIGPAWVWFGLNPGTAQRRSIEDDHIRFTLKPAAASGWSRRVAPPSRPTRATRTTATTNRVPAPPATPGA